MMRVPQFTALIALIASALAFNIPAGQANGVYQVSYVDGQEVHTLLDGLTDTTSVAGTPSPAAPQYRATRLRRANGIQCGGDALNHGDTDRANSELDKQCSPSAAQPITMVGGGLSFYSIVGCTVTYFCNFASDFSIGCSAAQRGQMSARITNACGRYGSGWTTDLYSSSYGYEDFCKSPGNNFCAHGRN